MSCPSCPMSAVSLAVVKEKEATPATSNTDIRPPSKTSVTSKTRTCPDDCNNQDVDGAEFNSENVKKLLEENETQLRSEFASRLEKETNALKEQFDFILRNEQIRTSYMLREAHRERQEKVQALQTQLECKNMAGLMYVMCSERRKSKLEKLRITEEYTKYIRALQDILNEGQQLILNLSRGYKTAAKVDQEWRDKMRIIIKEFQEYVYHFSGGPPETNQYIFDIPALLKTEAPIQDNPEDDPCDCVEEEHVAEPEPEKTWWEQLDSECRPFVMFGDMSELRPPQRRQVLQSVKAAKTAPRKWKEYVFNEMFLKTDCPNQDYIKDEYPKHLPTDRWECHAHIQDPRVASDEIRSEESSRRHTRVSMELRAAMGSILRIITSSCTAPHSSTKNNLLGARDSMEIASATRVRDRHRSSVHQQNKSVSISLKNKEAIQNESYDYITEYHSDILQKMATRAETMSKLEDEVEDTPNGLGSIHQDSLQVIQGRVPDVDNTINYEKICPMEKCQRMQVDSFMRTLPAYMRANPFTHFEHTFENYETCSPEQLEVLKQRIEEKKKTGHHVVEKISSDWTPSVEGVGVQTSETSLDRLPSCTCHGPLPSPAESGFGVFNVADLIPMKEALDIINKECFFDNSIEFDRFKVIGQEQSETICNTDKKDFKEVRVDEIKKILKRHPSMLDLFQGNTRC